MKKLLLLFLSFTYLATTSAQIEFAPPGATWYYSYKSTDITGVIYLDGYQKMQYERDTVIDNKTCKIISTLAVGSVAGEIKLSPRQDRFIYQEGYEIFHYSKGSFRKLYDFSLNQGDTLTVLNDFDDLCELRIDSVYTESINGEDIKHFIFGRSSITGEWYANEKVGLLTYEFFSPEYACTVDYPFVGPFRCYEDDNFPLYQVGTTPCEYYEDVSSLITLEELAMSIAPNPIHNYFEVSNENASSYDLSVFDVTGQLLHQLSNERAVQKKIEVSNWNPGTYFAVLKTSDGWAYKKLIKLP